MIPEQLRHQILRLHFVEGWKIHTIATQVGIHHSTVRRVLEQNGLSPKIAKRPSLVDPFLGLIHDTLERYPTLPASRLFRMCQEQGYSGKEPHFRRIISRLRPRKPAEAFQRLSTLPAEQAQVDWAHCGQVQVGRATRLLSAFVIVLSYSRMTFVRFFFDQRLGNFMVGHQDAFEDFEGVPRIILYDNLKTMVAARRGDAIRFNPTMLSFAGYYRYEPRPVAPYRGNEKGRVERRIRDLRSSFLVARQWKSLDEINTAVHNWCHELVAQRKHPTEPAFTVMQAWQQEKDKLLSLPANPFPAFDRIEVKAGKTPYIRFDKNDYSIPHTKVRRILVVQATPKRVRIIDGNDEIANHLRSFDKGAVVEETAHLAALTAQKRKARAERGKDRLRRATPSSIPFLEEAAHRGHNVGSATASFLRLLDSWKEKELEKAICIAMKADRFHVAAVKQILEEQAQRQGTPPPLPVVLPDNPNVRDLHVQDHDLNNYDLFGGNNDK